MTFESILAFQLMQRFQGEITSDFDSFLICQNCLRFVAILLTELYVLFLYAKEMIKLENSNYDKLDISIFTVSLVCVVVDIGSATIFSVGISQLVLFLKVIWSLVLYLIFLRLIFRREKCAKYFILSLLLIVFYYLISIIFFRIVPIRYSLLLIYAGITICAFHQFFFINQLLNHEKARQRELKHAVYHRILKQNEIQLLDQRRQYEHRVISSQVKYHLYLRRHFCFVVTTTLLISYYLLWNLQESRNSIGEFLVVTIIQVVPPMEYYFFACANQWLTQHIAEEHEENAEDYNYYMEQK